MKTGVGLALIAVGAILAFAVTTNTSVFNLHTAGWVLIIIGIIGIAIPRRGYGWVGRRVLTRQTRWRPGTRVEDVTYPTYVNRNPANTQTVKQPLPMPQGVSDLAVGEFVPTSPEPELIALVGVAGAMAAWARRRRARRRAD